MKVLHITPAFAPAYAYGGPISVLYELCLQLSANGHDVRVLTTDTRDLGRTLDVPTNEDIRVSDRLRVRYCKRLARHSVSLDLLRALPAYIRWADVVHLTAVYNFPTLPALLLCRTLGKPVVWSPHGVLQRWEGSRRTSVKAIWEKICKAIAPKRLLLHASSQDEAEESRHRFPGVPTVVIPWGITILNSLQRIEQTDILRLLYLGRLDTKKGIENLIDACIILSSAAKLEWSLTIAGSGPSTYASALAGRIREAGLAADANSSIKKICMFGEVAGDVKDRLYAEADVLVLPSYTENFSVVVGEALAREVPVIASKGTPWSQLWDMGCGLYVDNSPQSLADAIVTISQLPLREMGKRGREWVKQDFPWAKSAERMTQSYRELVMGGEQP